MRDTRRILLFTALLGARLASAQAAPPAAAPSEVGAPTGQRLLSSELSAGAGVQGAAYTFGGGSWGDLFITPMVGARLMLGGFTLDGDLFLSLPATRDGSGAGGTLTLRAGYTGQRFSIVAGPSVQYTPSAERPAQLLPSLCAQASFGRWGLSLGIFDVHALAPARLSLELGDFGFGLTLLGLEAHARLRLSGTLGLQVQALALQLANAEVALVTVAGVYGGQGGLR